MIDNEQETKNNYIKYIKIVFYMIKITTKNIEKIIKCVSQKQCERLWNEIAQREINA